MKKKKNKKTRIPSIIFILTILIILLIIIRKYTLASNINISSEIYKIEDNTIKNISIKTSKELFEKYFDLENCYLKVFNKNNEEITNGYIYTGSNTVFYNENNEPIKSYTNIVEGDITNDGEINNEDLTKLATYLTNNIDLPSYNIKSSDINNDNSVKINDLTLIENYNNSNYESLSLNIDNITMMTGDTKRIIPTIIPNIILNQNLNWQSNNDNITIDESGKITAIKEGTSIVTATTKDRKVSKEVHITVDNTPILSENSISLYRGETPREIDIKAIDYEDLTCSVEKEELAACEISNKKLIITSLSDGETNITVTSPTYGSTSIQVNIIFTSFTIFPKAWCLEPRTSVGGGIISGFNFGTLSVKNISDREIIVNSLINRHGFSVEAGNKTGDAIITFTESNGNNTVNFTAQVYKLSLEKSSSTINTTIDINITNENTGSLTCTSNNEEIATCSITDNKLNIVPIGIGETIITVKGEKCGSVTHTLTVNGGLE